MIGPGLAMVGLGLLLFLVVLSLAYFMGIWLGRHQQRSLALAHLEALLRASRMLRPHLTDEQMARGLERWIGEVHHTLANDTNRSPHSVYDLEEWRHG